MIVIRTEELMPDGDAAIAFLRALRPGGPWCLMAIPPDGGMTRTQTFNAAEEEAARKWIVDCNRRDGIYYSVNPTRGPMKKKAANADVARVEFLHVDIDPRPGEDLDAEKERIRKLATENLPEGVPPPTFVIFSGGGYQLLWRLREPIVLAPDDAPEEERKRRADEAARWNRGLELAFEADSCHDVSRVLRLPGTVNWPSQKKRKRGRVPALAELPTTKRRGNDQR